MKVSARGIALVESEEGCRLVAYPDPATGGEPLTIGVGHTGGVKAGDRITRKRALELLAEDLRECEDAITSSVTVPLTQNQFDALCSLIFNIGVGAFKQSTLLKRLNAGAYSDAAAQFGRWTRAGGRVYPPLVNRRLREAALFSET